MKSEVYLQQGPCKKAVHVDCLTVVCAVSMSDAGVSMKCGGRECQG